MSATTGIKRKRKNPDGLPQKTSSRPRKYKRETSYHSSSADDEDAIAANVGESGEPIALDDDNFDSDSRIELPNLLATTEANSSEPIGMTGGEYSRNAENQSSEDDSDDADENSESELDSLSSVSEVQEQDADVDDTEGRARKPRKRNDPTQFATSISKILSSKLTKDKRSDPVLSRSKDASDLSKELAEGRLEAKARRKLREDKKAALTKGRETDILGLKRDDVSAGAVAEEEKQLKKMAQRGVVKLFNAVRAAQTKGEEAAREARGKGVVGADKRQEHVNEMSKKRFLDLLVDGSK